MHSEAETEFRGIGRVIRWGLAGLFGVLAVGIVAAIVLRILQPESSGSSWPIFAPFYVFPFGFFLLFLFFFAFRWWFRPWRWGYPGPYWRHRSEATEILRQRYARGELSREQFEQMSRDLERTDRAP